LTVIDPKAVHCPCDDSTNCSVSTPHIPRLVATEDEARTIVAALFRLHYAPLVRFVSQFVHASAAAEEVVQELFLHLWEQRERDGALTISRAYLYAAARHRALNLLRHDRVVREHEEREAREMDAIASSPYEAIERSDLAQHVRRAVDRLPSKCRQVFLLSREGGLSYSEIARTLEISPKTVELHMSRALKALRLAVHGLAGSLMLATVHTVRDFLTR